ncbi:ParB/RepB/Spo0J family partition protein (plasmid) [Tunturibacter empetritectus]|uniref:ParB/RepB/Spo0J family partition protein n=1 Tax=Tunturiibacter empetritectus TaxID=3069691 RepID=A0AAU7ZIH9_9BACT
MQNSSAFQYLAIDIIHESTTNPRRTFDEAKLQELADSIRQHGLIQPITVRPNNEGFEIVAGARRYRASLLAEQFSIPSRIVELTDAQSLEWALVENSQRVDVHPYEEAQGFQQLLDILGYDVAALVEKSGKSASHIYARLSLLQLIPEVAEAFTQERITASHANLIARLPQESQAEAFKQCWRKDWQDAEPHLLPAKHVSAWIQNNLYLALADAPFDREDPTLNPAAGACVTCPRRSGYNTSLFSDVTDGDQCLHGPCYQIKLTAHIDREIAARPELIQIENAWRNAREQRPGAVQRGHFREIETVVENPDADPAPPCAAAKPAIIVYGKRVGTTLTVCTDDDCPVHDPRAAEEQAANPAPTLAPASEVETQEEAEERQRNYEQQRKEYEQEQERKAKERKQQFEREQKEHEAERARREKLHKARVSKFDRILEKAPAMFSAAQLKVFLRALVTIDPYAFDDVAEQLAANDENNEQTSEEILLSTIDGLPDDELTGFAIRLVLTAHTPIPRDGELDLLTEAETAFAPPQPKKTDSKKTKTPTPIKTAQKTTAKKKTAKKQAAA